MKKKVLQINQNKNKQNKKTLKKKAEDFLFSLRQKNYN